LAPVDGKSLLRRHSADRNGLGEQRGIDPDVGATLHKGEELGFFQFGGSDVIVLFQKDAVTITAEAGKHYLQGQTIGSAKPKAR
jgi:phosphatidylserine decarboxylase